jgi:uncharacterized protein
VSEEEQSWFRLGLLTDLVVKAPGMRGRTALVKLVYLLQTTKGVPLGYDFRLHTYGPFDSDVLNDLGTIETLGGAQSKVVRFESGRGYAYEYEPGPAAPAVLKRAALMLERHRDAIQWAANEFGRSSAADLELLTTIVFADREAAQRNDHISFNELAKRVKDVKPRFSTLQITKEIEKAKSKGLLAWVSG